MKDALLVLTAKWILDLVFVKLVETDLREKPYLSVLNGEPNFVKWLVATALTLMFWFFIRTLNPKDSPIGRFFILVQFFLIFMPSMVLYGMQDWPTAYIAIVVSAFFIVIGINSLAPRLIINAPPKWIALSLTGLGIAAIVSVYLGLMLTGGLTRLNFDLYDVYGTRDAYKATLLPGFGYAVPWTANVLNMAFLIYFVTQKKKPAIFGILLAQVLLFGMTNFKSFLFAPIAAIAIAIGRRYFTVARLMVLGVLAVIALGVTVYASGELMGLGLLRRVLIVPAALQGLYFEYYSSNPYGQMAGTRLAWLFNSPYQETTVQHIAQAYWGRDFSPNVGWIGDAYSQFGWVGVLVYSVILSIFLKIADALFSSARREVPIEGMMVGAAFSLCSSSLNTALLTHGLLLLLPVIWVLSYYVRQ